VEIDIEDMTQLNIFQMYHRINVFKQGKSFNMNKRRLLKLKDTKELRTIKENLDLELTPQHYMIQVC